MVLDFFGWVDNGEILYYEDYSNRGPQCAEDSKTSATSKRDGNKSFSFFFWRFILDFN